MGSVWGGRRCETLLATFCPASPRPQEQVFGQQSLDGMSLESRDCCGPGVRERVASCL